MLLREPVASSMIASVGYDEECEVLEVEFASGAVYRYLGVSEEVFDRFLAARSKGTYFNRHIKDAYPWEQVER
jgi:hypothetical protein